MLSAYLPHLPRDACVKASGGASCSGRTHWRPTVSRHVVLSHTRPTRGLWRCHAEDGKVPEGQLPADVHFEINETSDSQIEYDEKSHTLRVPLSALAGNPRRTRLVIFTCNKCGKRTTRAVNPVAWERGVVFGQCEHCGIWHTLSAKNKNILDEIRYADEAQDQDQHDTNGGAGQGRPATSSPANAPYNSQAAANSSEAWVGQQPQ